MALTKSKKWTSPFSTVRWEHCAAGVCGGVASTLVLHPLDLVKIRFQVNEGVTVAAKRPQYQGVFHALSTIHREAGVKGLYQGVFPNVWGAGASWGLYFLFYNAIKTWHLRDRDVAVLGAGQHMLAAGEAGVLTLILTNPIWVAKTRLCLQYDRYLSQGPPKDVASSSVVYRGMSDCLVKIYRYEGIRGLYKGFIPGMFGVSHGALQFMAYEELKKLYNGYRKVPMDTRFNTLEYLTFAALSKVFAASLTYPYQVVRSRLQDQHRQYKGVIDVITQTYRMESWRGFFKGLSPYLLHVTPNICIVFLVYEKVTHAVATRRKLLKDEEELKRREEDQKELQGGTKHSKQQAPVAELQELQQNEADSWLEGVGGFYKGLVPSLMRVVPACCITFVVYENIIGQILPSNKPKRSS